MDFILRLMGIVKTYGRGKRSVRALSDISLDLPFGQIIGLVGPNGAGKSTLLKVVSGLTHSDQGQVLLFGQEQNVKNNRYIGFLPENPQFFKNISGRELISFSLRLCACPASDQQVESILEQVGVLDAADRPIREYSKGMRQRIGLAQALAHQPSLLILDEPMSGLDSAGRTCIKSILKQYCNGGRSILFSSHDLSDVEDLCSRIVWVDNGHIRLDAPILDIQKQSAFEILWQKNSKMYCHQAEDEASLWTSLDGVRVSDGQLLRVSRQLSQRLDDLLRIGRKT